MHAHTSTHARTQADKSSPMLNCIELFDELFQTRICGRVRVLLECSRARMRAHVRARVCLCAHACVCACVRASACAFTDTHAHTHRLLSKRARAWAGDQPPAEQCCITQNAEVTQGEQHMTIYLSMYPSNIRTYQHRYEWIYCIYIFIYTYIYIYSDIYR